MARVQTGRVGVVLVDDHAGFRHAAAEVVAATDGFFVAAEASSGERAIELVSERQSPVLVVMDVNMPGIGGAAATRVISNRDPEAVVLLVSSLGAADLPPDLASCGAVGLVHKELFNPDVLTDAWSHRPAIR